jgi:hypothetical protein
MQGKNVLLDFLWHNWLVHSAVKLVQERAGNTLESIGIDKDFLSRTQAPQQLRERINK